MENSNKNKWLFLSLIFIILVPFSLYLYTLSPSLSPPDGAELTTASYTLGIAHAPGYPLYLILGKIFTFLPLANIAYRINLMSAIFSTLTCLILFLLFLKLTKNKIISLVAVLFLGFSSIFWKLSTISEVFTLNAFLAIVIIYLLFLWERNQNKNNLYIIAFIFGLGLTNHHSLILLAPAIILVIFMKDKRFFLSFKNISISLLLFLIGFSVYLYLPLRAQTNPILNWGDPKSLLNFLRVLARADFGFFPTHQVGYIPFNLSWPKIYFFFQSFLEQVTICGVIFTLIGLVYSYKKSSKLFWFLLISFLFSGILFISFSNILINPVYLSLCQRIYLLPFLPLFIWLGLGIEYFFILINRTVSLIKRNNIIKKIIIAFITILITLFPFLLLIINFENNNYRNYYITLNFTQNILNSLAKNAIFIGNYDTSHFNLIYAQEIEKLRPDIKVINIDNRVWYREQIINRWGKDLFPERIPSDLKSPSFILELFKQNNSKNPISLDPFLVTSLFGQATLIPLDIFPYLSPEGTSFRFLSRDECTKLDYCLSKDKLWEDYKFIGDKKDFYERDYYAQEILSLYSRSHRYAGSLYYSAGMGEKAKKEYGIADYFKPRDNLDTAFENIILGMNYLFKRNYRQAEEELRRAIYYDHENIIARVFLAQTYLEEEKSEDAKNVLLEILEMEPNQPDALFLLSKIHIY